MKEILDRLAKFDMFEIVVFSDEVILNHPVEEWPICDALISFFSKGILPVKMSSVINIFTSVLYKSYSLYVHLQKC